MVQSEIGDSAWRSRRIARGLRKANSYWLAGPEAVAEIGGRGHRIRIQDMIDAIREDRPPAVDGVEGRKSLEIVQAIDESAAARTWVSLPLTRGV